MIFFCFRHPIKSFLIFYLLFCSSLVQAGGALLVTSDGTPAHWDISEPLTYQPESGTCATFSNEDIRNKITTNLQHWTSIPHLDLKLEEGLEDLGNVTGTNASDFLVDSTTDTDNYSDGINPILIDDDGSIVVSVFGEGNQYGVLGFAMPLPDLADPSVIVAGDGVFNCFCLANNPSDTANDCAKQGVTFLEADLDFTMVHEFGHFLGLDHTQVNEDLAANGETCDITVKDDCAGLPTMFPVSIDPEEQILVSRDDQVALLSLYGDSSWEDDTCTITGSLVDEAGDPLRCADVQARSDSTADTIAFVSGALAVTDDLNQDGATDTTGECTSGCGDFVLRGLTPGKTYDIYVEPINPNWVGASQINPCVSGQLTTIVEEKIATISGECGSKSTIDLGQIKTKSTASTTTDSGGGTTSTDTPAACGVNGDFQKCDPVFGCALRKNSDHSASQSFWFLWSGVGLVMWRVVRRLY